MRRRSAPRWSAAMMPCSDSSRIKIAAPATALPVSEAALHRAVVEYLTIARPRCLWWHTAQRALDPIAGARLKRLGVVAGVPDFTLAWGGGSGFIELKRPTWCAGK